MNYTDVTIAVKALWLQYEGMATASATGLLRMDNAAHKDVCLPLQEDLSEPVGLMVAR